MSSGWTRRDVAVQLGGAVAGLAAGGFSAVPAAAGTPAGVNRAGGKVPTAWADLSLRLVQKAPGFSPPVAARAFAYSGLTLYEAVVPAMPGFRSLVHVFPGIGGLPRPRGKTYDWPTVANASLAMLWRQLLPALDTDGRGAVTQFEAAVDLGLRQALSPAVHARSVRRGRDVASAILAWARRDGGHDGHLRNLPPNERPVGAGLWVPTPPGFQPALQPDWGRNRCFAIRSGADVAIGGPPRYSGEAGSPFWQEAREVYDAVRSLTPEQQAIARFWSDDPGATPTPPGHSLSIATQVLRGERASLAEAAETYARLGMAVSDAFVACWHEKFRFNLLRPVTYARAQFDPAWLPPLVTPPFPEYPSGHSVQSGAAFQVLTTLFGKHYSFVDHTHDERGLPPRRFGSFLAAAEEAAISRLYGGIHFRSAIRDGIAQGMRIGRAASELPLRTHTHGGVR